MTKLEELNRVLPMLNEVGHVELRQARGIVMAAGAAIHDAQDEYELPSSVYSMYRVAQQAVFIRVNMTN